MIAVGREIARVLQGETLVPAAPVPLRALRDRGPAPRVEQPVPLELRCPAHPTIGVSSGFTDYGDYLGVALSRPLLAAGGVPVVLPYAEDADARARLLDRVDGLLLGFGRDIDPARYGRDPHPAMTRCRPSGTRSSSPSSPTRSSAGCRSWASAAACRSSTWRSAARCTGTAVSTRPPRAITRRRLVDLGRGLRRDARPRHHAGAPEPCDRGRGRDAPGRRHRPRGARQLLPPPGDRGGGRPPRADRARGRRDRGGGHLADDPRVVGVQWELQVSWVEDRRFLRIFADLVAAAREVSAGASDGSQRAA